MKRQKAGNREGEEAKDAELEVEELKSKEAEALKRKVRK